MKTALIGQSVNLGVLVDNTTTVWVGLQWDEEDSSYDLVTHSGWREDNPYRLKVVKSLPVVINATKAQAEITQEFNDPTSMGLYLKWGRKSLTLWLDKGEIKIISRI
jgi:hypothetical protein